MTYIEALKLSRPDIVAAHTGKDGTITYLFGCPYTHGLKSDCHCPELSAEEREKCRTICESCWNREIQEETETVEIEKEEKKMKDLTNVIRDAVLNSICDSEIEDAVKNVFEDYDYSDMIQRAVYDYLLGNIEDIAEDTVSEAVRDYMSENL